MARELTKLFYTVAMRGAFAKDFGLRDQITRAAGSIMHNIAEGFDGGTNAEFIKFLRYSQRSCSEVQSHLYVALDQSYISQDEFNSIYDQAAKAHAKVGGFIRYLMNNPNAPTSNARKNDPSPTPQAKNEEPGTKNNELPLPVLANRPPTRFACPRHVHFAAVSGVHGSVASSGRKSRNAATQCLYLSGERCAFAQLSDHDAR